MARSLRVSAAALILFAVIDLPAGSSAAPDRSDERRQTGRGNTDSNSTAQRTGTSSWMEDRPVSSYNGGVLLLVAVRSPSGLSCASHKDVTHSAHLSSSRV